MRSLTFVFLMTLGFSSALAESSEVQDLKYEVDRLKQQLRPKAVLSVRGPKEAQYTVRCYPFGERWRYDEFDGRVPQDHILSPKTFERCDFRIQTVNFAKGDLSVSYVEEEVLAGGIKQVRELVSNAVVINKPMVTTTVEIQSPPEE